MFTIPSVLSDITLPHWITGAIYSERKKTLVREEFLRNLRILHEKGRYTLVVVLLPVDTLN